ncbi:MAG: hypothetical protein ACTHMT_15075 [Verrucomicrobiota bacterium]|jgi:hypothetical protein
MHPYWNSFAELIRTPFQHADLIWGIIPLYFGWLLNELTDRKASAQTAVQTGFAFIWSGAHWLYLSLYSRPSWIVKINLLNNLFAVSVVVTLAVLLMGVVALISGLRKKFPPGCTFLGHSRFSNYFMIAIFPIQSNYLQWSWTRVLAIIIFAFPTWILMHFGLKPWRRK